MTEELKSWNIETVAGSYKLALIAAKAKGDIAFGLVCNKPVYIMNSQPLEEAVNDLIEGIKEDLRSAGISNMTADELKNSHVLKRHFARLVDDLFRYAIDDSVMRIGVRNAPAEEDVEYDLIESGNPVIAIYDALQNLGIKDAPKPEIKEEKLEAPVEEPTSEADNEEEPAEEVEEPETTSEPEVKRRPTVMEIIEQKIAEANAEPLPMPSDVDEEDEVEDDSDIENDDYIPDDAIEDESMVNAETLLAKTEELSRNLRKIAALQKIDTYNNIDEALLEEISDDLDGVRDAIGEILLKM